MSDVVTPLDIREQLNGDVLDYQQLISCLHGYAKPRDRITALLASGGLVRLRKGLYVLGERYRRAPLQREHLANLIYGPSYISLEYALGYHGLIPERVENVTSVTVGENHRFDTPVGVFTYQSLSPRYYSAGIRWEGEAERRFLMASPEKALVDKVWTDKRFRPSGLKDFDHYLFEDLRLDEAQADTLNPELLNEICSFFTSRKIAMLMRCLMRRRLTTP